MSATSADVVVVGGGPAGVAAAVELRRRGVGRVLLLDRERELGGATRHCRHSPFGLREFGRVYFGAAFGRRLADEAARAGVVVQTGHSVVQLGDDGALLVAHERGVETLTARRVVVSAGARETPRAARLLPGDRPIGVLTTGALQAYVAFHGLMPFRRPLIVGSEWVSLSAVVTCLVHGARPVAMLESGPHPLASALLPAFPAVAGIPFHGGAEIVDIVGGARVESVAFRCNGELRQLACDGVLLTGRFTPEAALFAQSPMGLDAGSAGPAIDQDGRCANPLYFAAGNVLRAIEGGGWSFREGRAVGAAVAEDLQRAAASGDPVAVRYEDPIKLVVPSLLRADGLAARSFANFQLRFARHARGRLALEIDGREVWRKSGAWAPERRTLAPLPDAALEARRVHFHFHEEA